MASAARAVMGLDIGRGSAKVVRAERRGREVVFTHAEALALPTGAYEPAEVVGKWLSQLGLARTQVVVGLPAQACVFQPLSLADDDPRPVGQAVAMEIARFNEMAPEPMEYGFAELPPTGGRRRLLLAMARPSVLADALAGPREMNLKLLDVVPTVLAGFGALPAAGLVGEDPVVLIDLGQAQTQLAVGTRHGVRFARSFQVGMADFFENLAEERGVTPSALAAQAAEGGLEGLGPDDPAFARAAQIWTEELLACLSIYQHAFDTDVDAIRSGVLAGGGARLPGLRDWLKAQAGIPVDLATLPGGAFPAAPAERFLGATGLALAGLGRGGPTAVSLLPAPAAAEIAARGDKPYWIGSAVAATLAAAAFGVGSFLEFQVRQRQLQAQTAVLERCKQISQQIEQLKAQKRRVEGMMYPIEGFLQNRQTAGDLVAALSRLKDNRDWIVLVADAESYFNPREGVSGSGSRVEFTIPRRPPFEEVPEADRPAARPADRSLPAGWSRRGAPERTAARKVENPPDPMFTYMIVEGYTPRRDLSTVRQLIQGLRELDFVEEADLLQDDFLVRSPEWEAKWAPTGERPFTLRIKLRT